MLKQTVQYTDFDGANKTKNIYFNLTRTEVVENLEIKDEFEHVRDLIGTDETRNLEMNEIRVILDLVKKLMKMSYGVQEKIGEDIVFSKNEAGWSNFTQTAVYDEFLIGLFENPEKAFAFLFGIWPKEFSEGIDMDQLKLPGMPVKMDGAPLAAVPDVPVAPQSDTPLAEGDPRPLWMQEKRSPTPVEMQNMSAAEMQRAYTMKVAGELDQ